MIRRGSIVAERRSLGGLMKLQKIVFSLLIGSAMSAQAYTVNVSHLTEGEELARAGEQLVTPSGFLHAEKVFDLALQAEPANKRAQFYKSFLKQLTVFKGIYARVRPLAAKLKRQADLNKAIAEVKDLNLRNFLVNGSADIRDEAGIQNFMVEYREAYNQLRLFAKENKDVELTLYFPASAWQSSSKPSCQYYSVSGELISWSCSGYPSYSEVALGLAEMESIQQMAAGMVLGWSIPSSYNLAGLKDLSEKVQQQHLKAPQILGLLKTMPQFLRLRSDESLSTISELGSDLAVAARWVLANQDTLCDRDSKKVCVSDDPNKFLNKIVKFEAQLSGPTLKTLHLNDGSVVTTQVDAFALSKAPIADLKSILPSAVDNCGQVLEYSDKTLGGVLPRGDLDSLVRLKPCYQ
jgi:hypothetical protein